MNRALLFFCVLFLPASLRAADRMALIIGNGAYTSANALPNPPNDAEDVGAALRTAGWKVSLVHDATVKSMGRALRQFCESSAKAEAALYFYAGHAVEVRGRNYLLPVDAKLAEEDGEDALPLETIALDKVLADLGSTGVPLKFIVLDSCRDNPLQRSWLRKRSAGTGLAEVAESRLTEGTMLVFSTAPGMSAADGRGRNSPFTAALLKRLPQGGSASGIFGDVANEMDATQQAWIRFDGSGKSFAAFGKFEMAPRLPAMKPPLSAPAPAVLRPIEPKAGATMGVTLPDGQTITLCYCPPGSFAMGSPDSEEFRGENEKQAQVRLTRGFWMAQTECTQGQWLAIMKNNPSKHTGSKDGTNQDLPVEQVSWEEAQAFIARLNASVTVPQGLRFAMPTEAQWEYACRAGTITPFSFGGTLTMSQANIAEFDPLAPMPAVVEPGHSKKGKRYA